MKHEQTHAQVQELSACSSEQKITDIFFVWNMDIENPIEYENCQKGPNSKEEGEKLGYLGSCVTRDLKSSLIVAY